MKRIKSLEDAEKVLKRYISSEPLRRQRYTLDRMCQLMNLLDNPQNQLRIVHVAGTSGKTSTSYYISALLQQRYKKIGLTVSPHVNSVNERVQINCEPISEAKFCKDLEEFIEIVESSQINPSYFELLVAFAYWEFARYKVDYAVIEVGLGGLLDGTNVIDREDKVCVITDIGLDHINILGNTLSQIAKQKAGIIKSHNAVFTHKQSFEIINVFKEVSNQNSAKLNIIDSPLIPVNVSDLPLFQQHNFSLAYASVIYILERDRLEALGSKEIESASRISIPGRMEIFKRGNKTVIIDGAHNQQKIHALTESVTEKFQGKSIASLISFSAGDEYRIASSLKEIAQISQHIIITTFSSEQDSYKKSVKPELLASELKELKFTNFEIIPKTLEAFDKLLSRQEDVLQCVGSFYLLDEVRTYLVES